MDRKEGFFMKTKKIVALVLAAMMFCTLFAACSKEESGDIDVGFIGPLTGAVAMYGTTAQKGAQLFIDEYNKAGGLNGRSINLISYDDKHDATEATNAYNKLVSSDEVAAIIGTVTSTPCLAVAQVSVEDNVPIITPTATQAEVTSFGDNMFRTCFLDPFQSTNMATFAKNELGASTAAIICNNDDSYSTGLADRFVEVAGEIGLEIVALEKYSGTDSDYKAQLTNIAAKNPDVVFVPEYYNGLYMILSQAKEVGLDAAFLGVDGADGILGIEGVDPTIVEGLYFSNHYSTKDESEVVQNFLKNYKETYNEEPSAFAALAYDAAMNLINALEKVSETMDIDNSDECRAAIIAQLAATSIDGVTGHITYDADHNSQKACFVIEIVDGDYTLYGKY